MYGEQEIKNKIFALTPEIGTSFWPTVEEIIPTAKDNLYPNLVYAWGPGIIQNFSYVSNVKLYSNYINPIGDNLDFHISWKELENTPSNIYAQIIDDSDSIINEIKLDSLNESLNYSWPLNISDEVFYRFRIKELGTKIPFKFYTQYYKFTTAGPIVVDSISVTTDGYGWATIKPFVTNLGKKKEIIDIAISIVNRDSTIIESYPKNLKLNNIPPGSTSTSITGFNVNYDVNNYKGFFNLKFEISSNSNVYWTDSTKTIITENNNELNIPVVFTLYQNYPNPFNPTTAIKYSIPDNHIVKLCVYDILGREVKVLVNEYQHKGYYEIKFEASDLSSGIYFYRLSSGKYIETKKLVLLK
ncbi:MAG: T9SS type A sorting domain-containing protein [Ignavibacteriales bacterium]|nr:T9SS type A sorting domain-containing protein [Ignavibacteriales bacterium]